MSRTVASIQQQAIDTLLAQSTTPSDISSKKVSNWLSWTFVTAVCIAFFEQILDIFTADSEAIVNRAGVGSPPWLIDRIKEFQFGNAVIYDSTTGTWSYPLPSSELIISRVGITRSANKVVNVKVAKSEPPVQLATDENTALTTYINKIGIGGAQYNVINLASDKIYISGEVIYDGQYSGSIKVSVEAAINSLFATLSNAENFGSNVTVNAIILAIKSVSGVKDFKLLDASGRADTTAFVGKTPFYDLATSLNVLEYIPESGYVVTETETGSTISDTLTYSAIV